MDVFSTVIISDAVKAKATAIVQHLSDRADGMWETALSESGLYPATDWISSGMMDSQLIGLLSSASALCHVCNLRGYPITLADCQALLAGVRASNGTFNGQPEDGRQFIARCNLKLITAQDI